MSASFINSPDKCLNSRSACASSIEQQDCASGRHAESLDRGILQGEQLPGAFEVPGRAHGEIPRWGQRQDDEEIPTSGQRQDDEDGDEFVAVTAELSRHPHDDLLVVEGVKTKDLSIRHCFVFSAVLVVASLLSVSAAMITKRLTNRSEAVITMPSPPSNDSLARPAFYNPMGNLNLTFAESWTAESIKGNIPLTIFMSPLYSEIVIAKLNRTDVNFTCFMPTCEAQIFDGLDISLLSKMLTDPWIGHVLDFTESIFLEGKVVALEDLYEGMVLTSLSGYPIEIRINPLRAKNISVATELSNRFYKNGVLHFLSQYPNPLIIWIGKSLFDVLVETNEKRHGDLSVIIELIQASPDDFKNLLELHAGDTSAYTLFAPTNAAMSTVNHTSLVLNETTLLTFLESHLVSGNFARRFWRHMPISAEATSDSGLTMTTQAGQVLDVKINDTTVTINGIVTIVQGDVFCEQGIMHVIDNPLSIF